MVIDGFFLSFGECVDSVRSNSGEGISIGTLGFCWVIAVLLLKSVKFVVDCLCTANHRGRLLNNVCKSSKFYCTSVLIERAFT